MNYFQAHVCIQQTVIDLIERGYEVHVVADATSSRSQMDRLMAFEVLCWTSNPFNIKYEIACLLYLIFNIVS